jgi:hypothetical protein
MDTLTHPKVGIIGALLVIALADNMSDSFGIHFYQESECVGKREVWLSTFTNFFTRLLVPRIGDLTNPRYTKCERLPLFPRSPVASTGQIRQVSVRHLHPSRPFSWAE